MLNKKYLFIYFTSQSWPLFHPLLPLLPPSPLCLFPQSTPSLYSLRTGQASHGHLQNMTYQGAFTHSTSSCIQAGQNNPAWGIGSQDPVKAPRLAPSPLPGVSQVDQATQQSYSYRGPRSVLYRLPSCWFTFCEFSWLRLVISVGFPVMSLTLHAHTISLLSRTP